MRRGRSLASGWAAFLSLSNHAITSTSGLDAAAPQRKRTVLRAVHARDSPVTRLRGLLGRGGLEPGKILQARLVDSHVFLRFPIDVVFLTVALVLRIETAWIPGARLPQGGGRSRATRRQKKSPPSRRGLPG